MPNQSPKRGAIPTPRHVLGAAKPYFARVGAPAAPPNFIVTPKQLSMWGNDVHGNCVTAEEAFAKACNNPEIFISDDDVIAWATRHGVLEGAYLYQVMTWMEDGGFPDGSFTYDDGSYSSVDWTNAGTLQSAISQGPVKLGIAADQLDATWQSTNGRSGWFATGYHDDTNEDHCTALCGYGSISWLAQQLGVQVPAGIDGTKPGYAMFTWDSIGIIDVPSMIAITAEAWLRRPTTVRRGETTDLFVSVYNGQQHFTYLDVNGNLQDAWYGGGAWHLQQINDANGAGATVPGEYIATPQATAPATGGVFVCSYNDQDHFAYLDANGNIQDCWYDGSTGKWNLQQINRGNGPTVPAEYVATNGPAVAGDLFVSVYNGQQHFTYRDQNGNLQDAWYGGGAWHLQQINDANGAGATVPGEYIATPQATAPATGGVFVCSYNDQDHFAYLDANGNIQDCWYDGSTGKWNLQQINRGNGPTVPAEYVATNGPAVAGDLFVSVYNGQQHFTYLDQNGNLQDAWYGGGAWHLQQINDANGAGATVPGEYIATPQATAPATGGVFVCSYNDQDHFAYLDANGNIQDCWYDGSTGKWNLQQINRGNGPTVPAEYVATNGPAVAGDLFVSVYNGQQHFTYRDQNGNLQDAWYGGGAWHLQQINDANGAGATVPGEYIATPQATAPATE